MSASTNPIYEPILRSILLITCTLYCYTSARYPFPLSTDAFQLHTSYPQTYLPRYSRNITLVAPEYFDGPRPLHNRQQSSSINSAVNNHQQQNLYEDHGNQYQYQQQPPQQQSQLQQHQHLSYLTNRAESSSNNRAASSTNGINREEPLRLASEAQLQSTNSGNSNPVECPSECRCNKVAQIADCSNRSLIIVPTGFPKDVKRINLAGNNIRSLGPNAFQGLKRLQRIDLSNNNLQKIDPLAFSGGLQSLNSLLLYSNKLKYLPATLFRELSQLQLLLLNDNSLKCIDKDLLSSLSNLNLLSLHDNNIETLANGTFDGLKNIRTIHLGKNPLICDCNLRWLADYLELNPIETSQALCDGPTPRNAGKRLSQLSKQRFRCEGNEQAKTDHIINQCAAAASVDQCPIGCVCSGSTIDCSDSALHSESRVGASNTHLATAASSTQTAANGLGSGTGSGGIGLTSSDNTAGAIYELPDVPDDVPVYVARVPLNDQRIKRIRQTGIFRRLANTQKLDLGNNKIVDIEDNVINSFGSSSKPERVVFVLLENQSCEPVNPTGSSTNQEARPNVDQSFELASREGFRQHKQQQFERQQQVFATQPAMTQTSTMAIPQSFLHPQLQQVEDVCVLAPRVSGDSPCYNGGICKTLNVNASNFTCLCPPGFAGPLCETNIDDCIEHQCQNGAICVDGIQSYKCICRDPTTSGEFCEQLNSYTTSSANSIAPIALPIIASSAPAQQQIVPSYNTDIIPQQQMTSKQQQLQMLRNTQTTQQQQQQQQQILTRSADFSSRQVSSESDAGLCKRITKRTYFDDGNGCQSARMLKMSECVGYCSSSGSIGGNKDSAEGCCVPTKVKRRRIRMQCNDGASYVKTIDLVKKCSCSSECNNIELTQHQFLSQPQQHQHQQRSTMMTPVMSYNASQEDQIMQITRLDAVD